MATVVNTYSAPSSATAEVVTWSAMATGDTINSWEGKALAPAVASLQISGTFGGATCTLQVSNDGSTWFTAKDTQGNAVTATTDTFFELSIAARFLRPSLSGGSGNSVDAILVMRG